MIVVGIAWATAAQTSRPMEIPAVLQQVDQIARTRDVVAAVELLNELDHADFWSFGGGVGPVTPQSVQLLAVRGWKQFLFDKTPPAAARAPGKWLELVTAPPDDGAVLERSLNDPNPAMRWLAMEKLGRLRPLPEPAKAIVTDIAATDPYVRIILKRPEMAPGDPHPPLPSAELAVFDAPLRHKAVALLKASGADAPVQGLDDERMGLDMLKSTYETRPDQRESVAQAIELLAPDQQEKLRQHIIRSIQADEGGTATLCDLLNAVPQSPARNR